MDGRSARLAKWPLVNSALNVEPDQAGRCRQCRHNARWGRTVHWIVDAAGPGRRAQQPCCPPLPVPACPCRALGWWAPNQLPTPVAGWAVAAKKVQQHLAGRYGREYHVDTRRPAPQSLIPPRNCSAPPSPALSYTPIVLYCVAEDPPPTLPTTRFVGAAHRSINQFPSTLG